MRARRFSGRGRRAVVGVELGPAQGEEIGGVGLVEDGEATGRGRAERPWRRRSRLATAWKVPPHARPATSAPPSSPARRSSSAAARRLKVSRRIRSGGVPSGDEAGDAGGERGGLAGPGARHDEQVPAVVLDGERAGTR